MQKVNKNYNQFSVAMKVTKMFNEKSKSKFTT